MMTLWTLGFIYLFKLVLLFSSATSRTGITESYGNSIFNFLRHLPTAGCTNSHSHQQHARVPYFPHSCLLSFVTFLMTAFLTRRMWFLTVALTGISLLTDDVENFSMCALAISVSSLENVYSGPLPIFHLGCLCVCCFWSQVLWAVCIFWKLSPCQWHCLQIFSPDL